MKPFLIYCFLLTGTAAYSQTYFQQEVNYKISVKLDDVKHELTGFEAVEYKNNSSTELGFIYFHLWPNGYRDNKTALAKQFIRNNSTKFYYAPDSMRGGMDSLDFKSEGRRLQWDLDRDHIDICKVILPEPLKPGETITITTPFRVKIPGDFSRLGHVGQSYQVSQWYPKPAVFDQKGWHPMPYLDQGEFYSEFGSFEVKITLPKNYRVAATGVLQEQEEKTWLDSIAQNTAETTYPLKDSLETASSPEYKTITWKQDKVHDFAWFADKRYQIMKSKVALESGKEITSWVYFLPKSAQTWQKAATYVDSAVYYYSKWVGEYPYSAATAVEGALSAGGGMEYPMVTVISAGGSDMQLDEVITHEVGHNWFYGILASNERQHTWMDEGFNTFIENRYMKTRYPNASFGSMVGANMLGLRILSLPMSYYNYLAASLYATYNKHERINQPAANMNYVNYGLLSYNRTAALLTYLEDYLGKEIFDRCMHTYFDRWKFKHPYPEDLQQVFEEVSGKKLDWFFDTLFNTEKQIDYAVKNVKKKDDSFRIKIKNTGKVASPFKLNLTENGQIIHTQWYEGHTGSKKVELKKMEGDKIAIDYDYHMPELSDRNNVIRRRGLFKKTEKLKLNLLTNIATNDRSYIHFFPLVGYNTSDNFLLGGTFHNIDLQGKKFNYYLAPMYSFGQNTLAGNFILKQDWFLYDKKIDKIRLMGQYKRFSGYDKISPSLTVFFKGGRLNQRSQYVQLSYNHIENRSLPFYPAPYSFARLNYQGFSKNALGKHQLDINLDQGIIENFGKLDLKYSGERKTGRRSKLLFNAYAGFQFKSRPAAAFLLYSSSSPDYAMDYYMVNRAGSHELGWFGRAQLLNDQGTFKTGNIADDEFMATVSVEFFRKKLFLRPFADAAITPTNGYYDVGLALDLQVIRFYFPIASNVFAEQVPQNLKQWGNSIRFSIPVNIPQMWNNLDKIFD